MKKNESKRKTLKRYKKAGYDTAPMRKHWEGYKRAFKSMRKKKSNPATKTRKGKTNRWISGKAFRVVRKGGKTIVEVKR